MILLDRVTKIYGKNTSKPAINRVSLHIEPREFVILVGTSGAGKSTLLKLLTREEKPTSGKIVVGGIDYDTLKDKHIPLLRRKIGVVFQDFKYPAAPAQDRRRLPRLQIVASTHCL